MKANFRNLKAWMQKFESIFAWIIISFVVDYRFCGSVSQCAVVFSNQNKKDQKVCQFF